MNKFIKFCKWVCTTPDNAKASMHLRILCGVALISAAILCTVLGLTAIIIVLFRYPVSLLVLIFVILPSYLWVIFYKTDDKTTKT
jgi:fatty acid desaturase